MKLAVIGSRGFSDYKLLNAYLNKIHKRVPITQIVSGGAHGADKLSERWAKENHIETIIFKPDWNKYGKRAGFLRNNDIIGHCDKCIAFHDGNSKGTLHSINLCKKHKKKCKVIYYDINYKRIVKIKQIYEAIEKNRFRLNFPS